MGPWTISSPVWALENIWPVAVNGLSPASGSFFSDFCKSKLSQPLERTHLPISGILQVTLSSLFFSPTNSRPFLSQNSDFYLLYSARSLGSANWKLPLGSTLSWLWSSFYWFDCSFLKYHSPALPLANSWEFFVSHILSDFLGLVLLVLCWRLHPVPITTSWLEGKYAICFF